jgi:SAM-dependent methyltransferase
MDAYTRRTRDWLDGIFAGPPGQPYTPHSPVHGFEPLARYIGTYSHVFAVLRELGRFEFDRCLDVGSGEGFLAEMVRRVFRVPVVGVDLSHRVCRRAAEFFAVPAAVGEVLHLPFGGESVDLVISTNTLEHVADVAAAYAELRRVARGVIVVGLPHARRPGEGESDAEPHAHLSMLTQAEMQRVFGGNAVVRGSLSRLARPLYALAAQDDVSGLAGYRPLQSAWIRPLYRLVRALAGRLNARRMVAWLCRLDDRWSRRWPTQAYESIVVDALAGARRRVTPMSDGAILRELLR